MWSRKHFNALAYEDESVMNTLMRKIQYKTIHLPQSAGLSSVPSAKK
jgi:hypothetical protein